MEINTQNAYLDCLEGALNPDLTGKKRFESHYSGFHDALREKDRNKKADKNYKEGYFLGKNYLGCQKLNEKRYFIKKTMGYWLGDKVTGERKKFSSLKGIASFVKSKGIAEKTLFNPPSLSKAERANLLEEVKMLK